ncbi:MAG: hypothetical protein DWQ34_14850 [Planctomycetota bacterium]|nr:MAG: hypothetical protein DWQ29_17325 [Planctomycetota bacterium]REJ91556.1 MAG: hypothetical protein DWQ34_14850 [Planctomycetota bacterium]REK20511.1 MAG: hypothetical protein DWQ41_24785 [Planctomycetota bacterium]REK28265.1 MAG: hypothetical protein DWQ45_24695 [Planctomycetota bacterium]
MPMHTFGKIVFLLVCMAFVGCHRWHRHHNACVDQYEWDEWEECDDDDDDDGCLWFGSKHKHRRRHEQMCYPPHQYGFAPPLYSSPMSPIDQCGCEPSFPPMMTGNWYGDVSGAPMSPGCSTCGDSPSMMPMYPGYSSEPTFAPQTFAPQTFESQTFSPTPSPVPSPAPASEYYNPQPTPATPTPASPDSTTLPKLGTPTAF